MRRRRRGPILGAPIKCKHSGRILLNVNMSHNRDKIIMGFPPPMLPHVWKFSDHI